MDFNIWAAFLGGAFGWVVRSVFDIYYLGRRDRIRALNLVRADIQSVKDISSALQQQEFFDALKNINTLGVEFVDKLYVTASIRAPETDTRILDRLGDALFRLEPDLQKEIVGIYRNLVTVRLMLDRVFTHYDKKEYDQAVGILEHVTPLIRTMKRQAKFIMERT